MSVAIVHYHLRRGGVTRVIEAQSRALKEHGVNHVVLAGTPYEGPFDLPFRLIPGLDYRESAGPGEEKSLTRTLREVAAAALGGAPGIWHVHNPTLGKNVLWPAMLRDLVLHGDRIVWQYHDFAEDGRPGNYRLQFEEQDVFPLAPQVRHTFINSRDRRLLIEAGVPPAQTSLLPNAVTAPSSRGATRSPTGAPVVLYPVRGIRRKNLGETCLLAGLAPAGTRFAVTLAPENPQWREVHDLWERFARNHQLNLSLGVVGNTPPVPEVAPTYENWLQHASHLLTTSVAEGFGLAFLEPLTLGKPLLGRDLPEITADFRADGIPLGDLYERILVPWSWIDADALHDALESNLRSSYGSYGRPLNDAILDEAFAALHFGDRLDFGNLPEEFQQAVAARAYKAPGEVLLETDGRRVPLGDWLAESLAAPGPPREASAVAAYSLDSCGKRLTALYRELLATQHSQAAWLDKSLVLDRFLLPGRFHFLRT